MTTTEFAKSLMTVVNSLSQRGLIEDLVDAILHDHRTLQGYAIQVMVATLKTIGEKAAKGEVGTDLRNEHAIKWCRALAETKEPVLRDGIAVW